MMRPNLPKSGSLDGMATRTSPDRSSKQKSNSKSKKTAATTEPTPYNVTETTQPWVVRAITRFWSALATPFGGAVRKMGPDVVIPVEQRRDGKIGRASCRERVWVSEGGMA